MNQQFEINFSRFLEAPSYTFEPNRKCVFPPPELKSPVGQIMHNDRSIMAVEQNKVLIPPMYNRYLAWGFSDLSLRVGNYDSDKVCLPDWHIQSNLL